MPIFVEQPLDFLDAFICECQDRIIVDAIDPDHAVLWFKAEGEVVDKIFIDAKVLGDTFDGADVMNFVALHVQAVADLGGGITTFQFQGNNSSNLDAGCPAMRARTSASHA